MRENSVLFLFNGQISILYQWTNAYGIGELRWPGGVDVLPEGKLFNLRELSVLLTRSGAASVAVFSLFRFIWGGEYS